jgi:hypothetical protein
MIPIENKIYVLNKELDFRSINILDGIENEIKLCVSSHTSFKYTNRKSTIYQEAIKQSMRTGRT